MKIPKYVQNVLTTIQASGNEAYLVGGCVRDMLLGCEPHDYDITTSALPEEILRLFAGHAIPTGQQHGTITVMAEHHPVEITTFRKETTYTDHRHPDAVAFSTSLREDLTRRDFTFNAIALSESGALVDYFDGQRDLRNRIVRCVGNAEDRFREDALRILRALRFSAVLGFSLDPETAAAVHRRKEDLRIIACERIREELCKLIVGTNVGPILRDYADVFAVFLPQILPSIGFDQKNFHHIYDVWEHTIHAVESIPPEETLRLVMLFHDLGKPASFTTGANGVGHFYGHAEISVQLAHAAMLALRFPTHQREEIEDLIRWHDIRFEASRTSVRRMLSKLGESRLRQLFLIQKADNISQNPDYDRSDIIQDSETILDALLEEGAAFSLSQLAVNGSDMIAIGYEGKEIRTVLNRLLFEVLEDRLPNEPAALLAYAKRIRPRKT